MVQSEPHASHQSKAAPLAEFCHQLMGWAQGLHRAELLGKPIPGSPAGQQCSAVVMTAVIAFHTPARAQLTCLMPREELMEA